MTEFKNEQRVLECDVAIVAALREEMSSVDIFDDRETRPVHNDLGLEIHQRSMSSEGGKELRVFTLLLDDQGPSSAGIATTKFLQKVRPKLLVLIGISGRISNDCKLCDVVLASLCDDSLYRAKKKDREIILGGKEWPLDTLARPLYAAINAAPPYYEGLELSPQEVQKLSDTFGSLPKTHHGAICTTPFVVDDGDFVDWLKHSRNRHVLATDMESSAIVQAAHENGVRDGRVLVIRGVSDLASGKSASDSVGAGTFRRAAIRNAANLANHIICNLLEFTGEHVEIREIDADKSSQETKLLAYREALSFLAELARRGEGQGFEGKICEWAIQACNSNSVLEKQLSAIAESAYRQKILKEQDDSGFVLSALQPVAIDYLIAKNIMESLVTSNEPSDSLVEKLSNVYPEGINNFCKAILAILPDEKKLVDTLIATYGARSSKRNRDAERSRERANAHICYLLGRVRTPQQQKRAAETLNNWRHEIRALAKTPGNGRNGGDRLERVFSQLASPEKRLTLRTICISLILLQQPGEADAYVRACIENNEFDSLNRGFHLEYYGDIDYDSRESMNNVDPIYCKWDKTFRKLFGKLSQSLDTKKGYPLRDVELQTILSLAQHRLAVGVLEEDPRALLHLLLKKHSASNLTANPRLQSYCGMMRDHLGSSKFKRISLITKFYELKKLPRTGWNDCDADQEQHRITPNPESVLSHTAGGLILIRFLLPTRLSKSDKEKMKIREKISNAYSKEAIANIFLGHDLAEAFIGDLTPRQRNDVTKAKERRVNSQIDLYSTYKGFCNIPFFREWLDFEHGITINGRVAREIDALENLLQLQIESGKSDVHISDLESWRDELVRRVETPMAKNILEMILE